MLHYKIMQGMVGNKSSQGLVTMQNGQKEFFIFISL